MDKTLQQLKYPIGQYDPPKVIDKDQRAIWIQSIADLPAKLKNTAAQMSKEQLNTPYRPGGWTGKQVVHHLADSHINSYMRFKLALTEDLPTIRPYDEKLWAELPDGKEDDIEGSLELISALHKRLVKALRNMTVADWEKSFYHPESKMEVRLDWNLGMYAWHGEHHLEHLRLINSQ
jgi:hypothetical protein